MVLRPGPSIITILFLCSLDLYQPILSIVLFLQAGQLTLIGRIKNAIESLKRSLGILFLVNPFNLENKENCNTESEIISALQFSLFSKLKGLTKNNMPKDL